MSVFLLVIAGILPVIVCAGFYLLDKKTPFKNLKYIIKQCIFGVVFGGLAILATEVFARRFQSSRELVRKVLLKLFQKLAESRGIALIAVVGHGMSRNVGIAARLFSAIARAGVNIRMIDQGSSELNIIVGVDSENYERTLRAVYEEFFRED